ncbi:TPA: hypothetical protein DIV49_02110 [Candidatus Saccharibacteria bacterium]|nr:hypothetical protein [Candidatus Saccharibacteria bacterium]HRJ90882.1 hypothetical protein [Candidatus Saccharibacteria bacterium]
MSYQSPYQAFIFESYSYDSTTGVAEFRYSFDEQREFVERVTFSASSHYNEGTLENALQLAFMLAGVSYYKAFPTRKVIVKNVSITEEQAVYFTTVYHQGLSQFVYENSLNPSDIASFEVTTTESAAPAEYSGDGTLLLQSGGKDSLLLAQLLQSENSPYTPWYISQSASMPEVIKILPYEVSHPIRKVDMEALKAANQDGALNGHVPITAILQSYAVIHAILQGKNTVLAAIGHEGEEPHAFIGDYAVTHQWSKTWPAEQLLQSYIEKYVGAIRVGSPLRAYSELKVARLFVEHCWEKYGRQFSSCNVANYQLGHDNHNLSWCGACPKCANSFLLFAAFVDEAELLNVFSENLFKKPELEEYFKGLLGIDGVIKPFECVGEVDELRAAYHLALAQGYDGLAFDVPVSTFDIDAEYPVQPWALQMIQ